MTIRGELKGYSLEKPLEKFEDHYLEKSRTAPNRVFRWSFSSSRGGTKKAKKKNKRRGWREKRHDTWRSTSILLREEKTPLYPLAHPSLHDGHSSVGTLKITSCKKRALNGTGAAAFREGSPCSTIGTRRVRRRGPESNGAPFLRDSKRMNRVIVKFSAIVENTPCDSNISPPLRKG